MTTYGEERTAVVVLMVVGFDVSYLLFASGGSGPTLVTTATGTAP